MMRRIDKLAKRFELTLGNDGANSEPLAKAAAANKKKVSRKQLIKQRDKSKKAYRALLADRSRYEAELSKLESKIKETRKALLKARSDLVTANEVLGNMDLVDCNYVMHYSNTSDVAYIVDKVEHFLSIDGEGEATLTPMPEHRRAKRKEMQEANDGAEKTDEDSNGADDGFLDFDVSDVNDIIPGIEKLDDPAAPRSEEEFTEGRFPSRHPNLRFSD